MRTLLPLQVGMRVMTAKPARARSALFLLVGALVTASALVCIAGFSVRQREGQRSRAIEPVFGKLGQQGLGYTALTQTYRGQPVLLSRVAGNSATKVLPPGLTSVPAPGSVVVSPRLAMLIGQDPAPRAWFGSSPTSVLTRAGVGSAGDLRAFIGVEEDQLGPVDQRAVVGFGATGNAAKGFGWYEAAGFALFVGLPAAGVMITASRFGRRSRHERHLALRLAGMSTAGASTVSAVEMALPVSVGGGLAVLAFNVLVPDFFALPVVGRSVFGADARISGWLAPAVLTAVCVMAGLLGARSATGSSTLVRLGRLLSPRRLGSPRSAFIFGVGIAAVAFAWMRKEPRDPVLWLAILLLGAGLPGATAFVAQGLARMLARPQARLATLISMRRILADPQATTRIAGTAALAVFVVVSAQPITQIIATTSRTWIAAARDAGTDTVLGRAETLEAVPLRLSAPRPGGLAAALPAAGLWTTGGVANGRPSTTALIGTCDEVRALVEAALPTCRPESLLVRSTAPGSAVPATPDGLVLRSADGRSEVAIRQPSALLVLPDRGFPIDASVLLPPDDPALAKLANPYMSGAYMRVKADEHAWEAVRAWVIGSSPAYRLENAFEPSMTTDNTSSWVLLGLMVTAVITVLAAMLIAVDESGRRREWFALRAMGMSRLQLVRIQAIESILTGFVAMFLAVLAGIGVGSAFLRAVNESLSTTLIFVTAGVAGFIAVVVAAVATSATAHARSLA